MSLPTRLSAFPLALMLVATGASIGPAEQPSDGGTGEAAPPGLLASFPGANERPLLPPSPVVSLLPPEEIGPEPSRLLARLETLRDRSSARERMPLESRMGDLVPVTPSLQAGSNWPVRVMVCGCAMVMGVCLVLLYRIRGMVRASEAAADIELLRSLIANRLPIVEEAIAFPRAVRLYGTPLAGVSCRVDDPQPPCDPHIPALRPLSPVEVAEGVLPGINWISPPEQGIEEPSYLRRSPAALERTLTRGEGEGR